jgi:RimJ/RimL family protein N-acetyltransferase
MVDVEFIPLAERRNRIALLREVAHAVFGTPEKSAFMEQFVPRFGQVPEPKVDNFTNFLVHGPNCLWVVYYSNEQKEKQVVGFILIADMPFRNSIGFGIDLDFANMGIMTRAWHIIEKGNNPCIVYPLYGYTSTRNESAIALLTKLGFENTNENVMFGDEPSYKFIK